MTLITDTEHWPLRILSTDGNVSISCRKPSDSNVDQKLWTQALTSLAQTLSAFYSLGLDGDQAIKSLFKDLPQVIVEQSGLESIAYTEPNRGGSVYSWPDPSRGVHQGFSYNVEIPDVPFRDHKWDSMELYHGNYGPVSNIKFSVREAVLVSRDASRDVWLALLEALVFEQSNDAILQKTAFVEVYPDRSYITHESSYYLENAGGGGPYDRIMSDLVVSARGDVIARLPNHTQLGNALVALDLSTFRAEEIGFFQAPSPELIPAAREVDTEVMKYLRRFPDHVTQMPGHSFEKIVAEILSSHGFSDIQLNVRNKYGEIDILAFEGSKGENRQGYIVECKRYRHDRKVTLREAHVLAMKRIHMRSEGIDRAMLVTTSDFTKPARELYDSAWGMELKAYDEVVEWLREYKPPKNTYHI